MQGRDHAYDAVELFRLAHLRTGACLYPAHVKDVGTLADELLGAGEETVQIEVRTLVIKRIGRAVEDAYNERPGCQVIAMAT